MYNGERYSDPTADAVVRKEMKEYYKRERARRCKEATLANEALKGSNKVSRKNQRAQDESTSRSENVILVTSKRT